MLLREESQSYIEAVEPEVEAIFRSRETLELAGAGEPTLPVQAFVCGIRKEDEFQVFVAFHGKSIKRNLVYSIAMEQKGKGGYEVALKRALDACKAMGLAMESVNLKFSTAMREVVIRDIPVLLSPAAAQRAAAKRAEELAELERLTLQPEESEAPAEAAAGLSPARRAARERARQERQEEARAAARKLAAESIVDEKARAARQAVEGILAAGFEVLRGAADAAPAAPPPGKAEQQQPTPAADGDAQEMQRLARELDRLMAEKTAAEQRVAELSATARQAAARAEAERAERERLEAEKAAAERRAAELSEAARQAEQRVEVERDERAQLLAEKAAAERRAAELAEAARSAEARVVTSRSKTEQQVSEQVERERAERERLIAEKAAMEQRAAKLAEAVRQAALQIEAERTGRERLEAEKAAAEQRVAELTSAARRAAELAEVARQAAERAEAERRERERLEVEKARIERRLQEQTGETGPAASGTAEPARPSATLPSLGGRFAQERRTPDVPVAPPPKPSSRPAVPGAFFRVEPELADIVYDSADDVLEVRQSISMTQLSLEGFPNQYCTAYIVAMKKGRGRQVYVAFRLAASNRVLVYAPLKPPQSQEAYARALKEADKFLRVTGIETESLPLEKSKQGRARALGQIPVLRQNV